jgi:glycosyltransferase involved in cell wall biosynthesis
MSDMISVEYRIIFVVFKIFSHAEGKSNIVKELSKTLASLGVSTEIIHLNPRNLIKLQSIISRHKSSATVILVVGPSSFLSLAVMAYLSLLRRVYNTRVLVFMVQPTLLNTSPNLIKRLTQGILWVIGVDKVLVQSKGVYGILRSLGLRAGLLPSGVSTEKFRPCSLEEKLHLREKYGFPAHVKIVLHVGPIKRGRGIEHIMTLCNRSDIMVLIIGRPYDFDAGLVKKVTDKGCVVYNKFFKNIDEIYKLSDVYVFPTKSIRNVVDLPLSILEAMACNLVVVTSQLDGITTYWKNNPELGLYIAHDPSQIPSLVEKIVKEGKLHVATRDLVKPFDWKNIARMLLIHIVDAYAK